MILIKQKPSVAELRVLDKLIDAAFAEGQHWRQQQVQDLLGQAKDRAQQGLWMQARECAKKASRIDESKTEIAERFLKKVSDLALKYQQKETNEPTQAKEEKKPVQVYVVQEVEDRGSALPVLESLDTGRSGSSTTVLPSTGSGTSAPVEPDHHHPAGEKSELEKSVDIACTTQGKSKTDIHNKDSNLIKETIDGNTEPTREGLDHPRSIGDVPNNAQRSDEDSAGHQRGQTPTLAPEAREGESQAPGQSNRVVCADQRPLYRTNSASTNHAPGGNHPVEPRNNAGQQRLTGDKMNKAQQLLDLLIQHPERFDFIVSLAHQAGYLAPVAAQVDPIKKALSERAKKGHQTRRTKKKAKPEPLRHLSIKERSVISAYIKKHDLAKFHGVLENCGIHPDELRRARGGKAKIEKEKLAALLAVLDPKKQPAQTAE